MERSAFWAGLSCELDWTSTLISPFAFATPSGTIYYVNQTKTCSFLLQYLTQTKEYEVAYNLGHSNFYFYILNFLLNLGGVNATITPPAQLRSHLLQTGWLNNNATLLKSLTTLNYSQYFAACAPTQCSYTSSDSPRWLDTVTLTLGLLGGIAGALRVIVNIGVEVMPDGLLLCFDACLNKMHLTTPSHEDFEEAHKGAAGIVSQQETSAHKFSAALAKVAGALHTVDDMKRHITFLENHILQIHKCGKCEN